MNYIETCPHCRHRHVAYTLHLNQPMAEAFLLFLDARIRLGRGVKKGELELTNSQYSNFQNLRHFGIIAQLEGRGGPWEATPAGWAWAQGLTTLDTPAAHLAGETLPADHLAWATHDGPRTRKRITDLLPAAWREREAYQAEAAGPSTAERAPAHDHDTDAMPYRHRHPGG